MTRFFLTRFLLLALVFSSQCVYGATTENAATVPFVSDPRSGLVGDFQPELGINPLQVADNKQPDDAQPVTRGQFATALYQLYYNSLTRAQKDSQPLASPVPTFLDVLPETSIAQYQAIEWLRLSVLSHALTQPLPIQLWLYPQGYFSPKQPITRLSAWVFLSSFMKPILPVVLSLSEQRQQLAHQFTDADTLPDWAVPMIFRMWEARLLAADDVQLSLNSQAVLTMQDLRQTQAFLSRLQPVPRRAEVQARKTPQVFSVSQSVAGETLGTEMVLSPAHALFQARMGLGDTVYFTAVKSVTLGSLVIPEETRFRGTVIAATDAKHFSVYFNEYRTPEGNTVPVAVDLPITFTLENPDFYLPGQQFSVLIKLRLN